MMEQWQQTINNNSSVSWHHLLTIRLPVLPFLSSPLGCACLSHTPALRPALMLAQCTAPGEGLVVLHGSHRTHWWGVYFSGPGSSNRLIKRSKREVGCVGLREGREELDDLEPVIYRLVGFRQCFFLNVLPPACIPTYYSVHLAYECIYSVIYY